MKKTAENLNTMVMEMVKVLNDAAVKAEAARVAAEVANTAISNLRPMMEKLVGIVMEMDKEERKQKKEPELKTIVIPAKNEKGIYVPTKFYLGSALNRVLGRPDKDYAVAEMLSAVPFGHVAWIKRGEVVWSGKCEDYIGSTMSRWVDQWGYEFILKWWDEKKGKVGKCNHNYDRELVCELYRDGWKIEDISKECNVSRMTIFSVVKAAGLKRNVMWNAEELRRLVEEGRSDKEIAEMKGTSVCAVTKARSIHGILRTGKGKAASNHEAA